MSAELRYKESITHSIWEEWKLTDARIVAGRVEISPGGYIQFLKAPKIDEEKAIPQKYKVVITYNDDDLPILYSKSNLMFELHMTPKKALVGEEQGTFKTITTSAHPNTQLNNVKNKCITYLDTKGGTADLFKIILRNNLHRDITVVSVDVYPSYSVDDNTLAEIEQHIPSILHYTNSDRVLINGETKILQMDVGAVMNTNLQVHLLANGTLNEDCNVRLDFIVDKEPLPYSPLEFNLPAGPFLLSIPTNIMQVESGNNSFEVYMTPSNGTGEIKPFKLQCSIDGKGMLSKSSSAAPSANEILLVPIEDLSILDVDDVEFNYIETQCIPIPTEYSLDVPVVDVDNIGTDILNLYDIEQTRVAEDVWFGPTLENGYDPGYNEIFTYNTDIIKKQNGKLQFKQMGANTLKIENTQNWTKGDLYTIELDNSETSKYERLTINAIKRSVKLNRINLNNDNFNNPENYTINDNIGIVTSHLTESTNNLVTDNESYTHITVNVDESMFNDIDKLK